MLEGVYKQTITYWASPVPDGFGGNSYTAPVTLLARWEDKNERFINDLGIEELSASIVYVQQDIALGEFLALGDQTGSADPADVPSAFVVKQFDKITSVQNVDIVRKVYL